MRRRRFPMVQATFKIAKRGVVEIIGFKRFQIWNCLDRFQGSLWSAHLGESHGAIESDDRRIVELQQSFV